jgi:hypothetical protein
LEEAKEKQKFYYDRNTNRIDYKVGDKIKLWLVFPASLICAGKDRFSSREKRKRQLQNNIR